MNNSIFYAKQNIAGILAIKTNLDESEIEKLIEIPPESALGDFAFPCFKLAKAFKKSPNQIAVELSESLSQPPYISAVKPSGAYLNFFLNKAELARAVIDEVRTQGARFGGSDEGGGGAVCIDYSSINIAKPFHIGHLSSTVIGHSLYRIFSHMGYKPVGINHLGDWGTQFGKLISAYKKWGDKKEVEEKKVRELLRLYVRFHDEAERDASLVDEARAWFKRIEDGDDEALSLFEWFKELTLSEVGRVYDMLGISFDSYAGESFYNDKMDRVINELNDKKLLVLDEGAYIVDLNDYNMPPCIVLRSDGATLYATRDIAAAIYRKETYDFVKSLYVVAYQQDLHFRQLFKVMELMGYPWAKDMHHVAFGMVSLKDKTLSSREGNVVFLEDVLNAAAEKTLCIMKEKSPDLEDMQSVAREVGVGAVVFAALYNNRIKDVSFTWERALNFDGETGPYLQYTHARCCSLLKKAGIGEIPAKFDPECLCDDEANNVIRAIAAFKQAVKDAQIKYEPYLISRSLINLAQAYNKFYYENRILGEDEPIETARLALSASVKSVLSTGLYLIGLSAPQRM